MMTLRMEEEKKDETSTEHSEGVRGIEFEKKKKEIRKIIVGRRPRYRLNSSNSKSIGI